MRLLCWLEANHLCELTLGICRIIPLPHPPVQRQTPIVGSHRYPQVYRLDNMHLPDVGLVPVRTFEVACAILAFDGVSGVELLALFSLRLDCLDCLWIYFASISWPIGRPRPNATAPTAGKMHPLQYHAVFLMYSTVQSTVQALAMPKHMLFSVLNGHELPVCTWATG